MTSQPEGFRKTRWGAFFQGAVAGIEGRLDAILAEDGKEVKKDRPERPTDQASLNSEDDSPAKVITGTEGEDHNRLGTLAEAGADSPRSSSRSGSSDRLQQRLAKAVLKQQQRSTSRASSELSLRGANPASAANGVRDSTELNRDVGEDERRQEQFVTDTDQKPMSVETISEALDSPLPKSLMGSSPPTTTASPMRQSLDSTRSGLSHDVADTVGAVSSPATIDAEQSTQVTSSENGNAEVVPAGPVYTASEKHAQEEVNGYLERIDALQAKVQFLAKEAADSARRAVAETSPQSVERKLAEKDERIVLLMEEGEKLSKTELKHLNIIKKLRMKGSEDEKALTEAKNKLKSADQTTSDGKLRFRRADVLERQANDRMNQIRRAEDEIESLKAERDATKSTIGNLMQQLSDAVSRAERAESISQAGSLETERALVANLKAELSTSQKEARAAAERVAADLRRARESAAADAQRAKLTELELRSEISTLESTLEVLRARTEEASSGPVRDSQANVMRQVETLQTQYAVASENWQGLEAALSARLEAAEKERDQLVKKELEARKKARDAGVRAKRMEEELARMTTKLKEVEEDRSERKALEWNLQLSLAEREKALTDMRADLERRRQTWEANMQKKLDDQKAKWRLETPYHSPLDSVPAAATSPSISQRKHQGSEPAMLGSRRHITHSNSTDGVHVYNRPSSRKASGHSFSFSRATADAGTPTREASHVSLDQLMNTGDTSETPSIREPDEIFPDDAPTSPAVTLRTPTFPFTDALSASTVGAGPSVQLVERLSTSVRRLESEKAASRDEIARLTTQRDEARQEMLRLMRDMETKSGIEVRVKTMEQQLAELQLRYEGALEMLGEKSERCEELTADVDDLKKMYRDLVDSAMR